MGRWAQSHRRGSAVEASPAELASPVLTWNAGVSQWTWTWAGVDPVWWVFQMSEDGGNSWGNRDMVPGSTRDLIMLALYYTTFRIVGTDGDMNEITGPSNVVVVS
jgi:hypothetical protein